MRRDASLSVRDLPLLRLSSHRIIGSDFGTPPDVVAGMGAIQAQDFLMARWAIGARLPGSTDESVRAAVDDGRIIRSHLLRPTWHLAAAADVRWLLGLSAPQIKGRMGYRDRQLELNERLYARSNRLVERALRDATHLTRQELIARFRAERIPVDENRASHLLMRAELDGIACSGGFRGGRPTYALLDERVPPGKPLSRDEALATLAQRYFTSRGPATVEDFAWWSGLPSREARRAVDMVKGSLSSASVASRAYLAGVVPRSRALATDRGKDHVFLLPAFDEFFIGYADRGAVLPPVSKTKAVHANGVFRPIIVERGLVVGVWSWRPGDGTAQVRVSLFRRPAAVTKAGIHAAVRRLEAFWGVEAAIEYPVSPAKRGRTSG